MARYSIWRETLPISLRYNDGQAIETPSFPFPRVGVTPELDQWDLTKSDPSGYRHLKSHEAFLGVVGSGMGTLAEGLMIFDLNDVNISAGSGVSDTRCMTFRLADRECSNTRVSNIRVWISDDSDFLIKDYKVLYETSSTWQPNKVFEFSDIFDDSKILSTTVPATQNLWRQDQSFEIHGSGDLDSSQYLYIALASSGTIHVGKYELRLRVSFAMDNMYPYFT